MPLCRTSSAGLSRGSAERRAARACRAALRGPLRTLPRAAPGCNEQTSGVARHVSRPDDRGEVPCVQMPLRRSHAHMEPDRARSEREAERKVWRSPGSIEIGHRRISEPSEGRCGCKTLQIDDRGRVPSGQLGGRERWGRVPRHRPVEPLLVPLADSYQMEDGFSSGPFTARPLVPVVTTEAFGDRGNGGDTFLEQPSRVRIHSTSPDCSTRANASRAISGCSALALASLSSRGLVRVITAMPADASNFWAARTPRYRERIAE